MKVKIKNTTSGLSSFSTDQIKQRVSYKISTGN